MQYIINKVAIFKNKLTQTHIVSSFLHKQFAQVTSDV